MTKRTVNYGGKTSEDYYKVRCLNDDGSVSTMSFHYEWLVPYLRAAGGQPAFNRLARECARGYAGRSQGTRSAYVRRQVAERLAAPQN